MSETTLNYPRRGVIQNWRRDRGYGEIRDLQNNQCYLAPISGNRGEHIAGGQMLDGRIVRFRIRAPHQPVEWVSEAQIPAIAGNTALVTQSSLPPVRTVTPPPLPALPVLAPPNIEAPLPPPPPIPHRNPIREFLQSRGVTSIYHFTRETNLAAIIQHGLLPRSALADRNIPFTFNDTMRLDRAQESISVSISFPNFKMFYRIMRADTNARWVVLLIAPDVLWTLRCAFCKTNAASNAVRFRDMNARMTLGALEEMYAVIPNRTRDNIPSSYPTSPQAEVLVFDPIPVSMIKQVCVRSQQDLPRVRPLAGSVECVVKPAVFGRRRDWADWQPQFTMQMI